MAANAEPGAGAIPAKFGSLVPPSFDETAREFPHDRMVDEWIAAQAAATPARVAIRFGESSITYARLERASEQLADRLRNLGVGPGQTVGVCLERSAVLVVGLLGVLKSGAAYVPMDPAFPADRLRHMVEDAAMPVIVTQESLVERLPEHRARVVVVGDETAAGLEESATGLAREISAAEPGEPGETRSSIRPRRASSDLAYVMYTSGSTGRPKGVRIRHRSVVNFLNSMRREPGLDSDDVLLAVTTYSFDIAGLELFLPLVVGATVVLATRETAADGYRLREEFARHGVTVMQATPVTWRMLLEAGWEGSPRLKILVGGEAVPRDLVARLRPRCASLWNMYGPTETTIWSTTGRLEGSEDVVTIGRPIDNTQVHILDSQLRQVPPGEAGELVIGGEGVAAGYLNRPELTAERFVPDPFSGRPDDRLYRTGDLARWRPDGSLECLGRMDDQVKIRGHRIELGDVEAALREEPQVRAAAVAAREDGVGGKRLVAYLVPRSGAVDLSGVRKRLRGKLPEYMVPVAWVTLERLPLTPNGKLDRRALPEPGPGNAPEVSAYVAPATDAERRMTSLWAEVLGIPRVGMTDGFFELGGHSLAAVRLFSRVEQEFGRRLSLASLFQAPTPAGLLDLVSDRSAGGVSAWQSLVPLQIGDARPPLFCVHGAGGNLLLYRDLIRALGPEVPFHGFQSRGLDGRRPAWATIEEMAAAYVEELLAFRPVGPYLLGGYCMGGTVAYEMARQLHQRGRRVGLLALFDTYNFAVRRRRSRWAARLGKSWQKVFFHASNVLRARGVDRLAYLREKARRTTEEVASGLRWRRSGGDSREARGLRAALRSVESTNHEAGMDYQPGPCPVRLTVFKPERNYASYPDPRMGWEPLAKAGLDIVPLPLNPHAMLVVPYVQHLALALRERLERAWREADAQ